MNKEQQELLDEAYKNFEKQCIPGTGKKMSKEEFIEFIKTNNEFSKKLGLTIKERELSLEEREKIAITKYPQLNETPHGALIDSRPFSNEFGDSLNIPTKLITVTYNDKTIENYE